MCRRILQLEEEMVQEMCSDVLRVKPDLVITEKGVSDLAQHFLMKAGVSVIRRVRKTDNNRIARYEQFVSELILYWKSALYFFLFGMPYVSCITAGFFPCY